MTAIPKNMLSNLFENAVTSFVKENLESIMRTEIKHCMEDELSGEHNSPNGYYKRTLHTKYGHIEDLQAPRDRNGQFQTHVFVAVYLPKRSSMYSFPHGIARPVRVHMPVLNLIVRVVSP